MEIESRCPICRDYYEDAVLARDGFAYCRDCIVRWAGHGERLWKSPRTNEFFEGHPILCRDVERNAAAKALRRQDVLAAVAAETDVLGGLAATHCGAPLLEKADCERLLWHPVVLTSPYVHLSVALRAGALAEVPPDVLQELCRLDRCAVHTPLLQMEVVVAVVREVVRRCEAGEAAVALLKGFKAHLAWRNSLRDAVEVPLGRTHHEAHVGFYHRSWRCADATSVLFVKGDGVSTMRYYLNVPLFSGASRGACEPPMKTSIYADAGFLTGQENAVAQTVFSSEAPLRRDELYWRVRRGGLPFPDSRGGEDTEAEDWSEPVVLGCACILEAPLRFLPQGFKYHRQATSDDHRYEFTAEMNLINETLLKVCEAPEPTSTRRVAKRKR